METPRYDDDGDQVRPGPVIEDPGRVSGAVEQRPDPEVRERARRRTFTPQSKLEMLAAYSAAPEGEKGALLRREGLCGAEGTPRPNKRRSRVPYLVTCSLNRVLCTSWPTPTRLMTPSVGWRRG